MPVVGRCYEEAFWYLMNWGAPDMYLCHGVALQETAPFVPYGHAWIEQGSRVIEVAGGSPRVSLKIIYYNKSGIRPAVVQRYTREQARTLALQRRHYGPWDVTIGAALHHRDKTGRCINK
ncbi:MAG TPA: hypothetical protein VHP11_08110 [Tepidisphaeraceae bacterium]|nr:hypothetical protein [Tepidisphaeraceae bacterium]